MSDTKSDPAVAVFSGEVTVTRGGYVEVVAFSDGSIVVESHHGNVTSCEFLWAGAARALADLLVRCADAAERAAPTRTGAALDALGAGGES